MQVYSIINRLYTRPSLKYVWKSQIIITCCDSSSPNWQYTNMANKKITYISAACATSVWSPQLCQVMHNIISNYSVTSWAFEDILQLHASNSVEEGLWLTRANESQNGTETSHITCWVLAVVKILLMAKIVWIL